MLNVGADDVLKRFKTIVIPIDGNWSALLSLSADPTITFLRDGIRSQHTYLISTFLKVYDGRPHRRFALPSSCWWMPPEFVLEGAQLDALTSDLLRAVPGSIGRFEVKWVPNDPRFPF